MHLLPFFILTILSILFISAPFFKKLDEPPTKKTNNRINTLDGLRGFLAFAVVVSHLDSTLNVINKAFWGHVYNFNTMLGAVGVSVFFMITAYLFWNKLLTSEGKTNWKVLYLNRAFRIAPVYYFTLFIALILVTVITEFRLKVSLTHLILTTFKWSLLGFHRMPDINGYDMTRILSVTWSLRYEWIFYISLFFTSIAIRKRIPLTFCVIGFILSLACLLFTTNTAWSLFFGGMICATVSRNGNVFIEKNNILFSVVALLCLSAIFIFFKDAYGPMQVLLLLAFFYLVVNGTTLFGLLALKGSHRFGNISYSLYLLHLIILYLYYQFPIAFNYAKKGEFEFWITTIPAIAGVIVLTSYCYLLIEKTGISYSKRLLTKYHKLL
jgi:peptidoglycan/LPS O-acetylase OafA/YrhL